MDIWAEERGPRRRNEEHGQEVEEDGRRVARALVGSLGTRILGPRRVGDGEGMSRNGFLGVNLVWRKKTCWAGFDHEVLKALRKSRCWAGFDHEVLKV